MIKRSYVLDLVSKFQSKIPNIDDMKMSYRYCLKTENIVFNDHEKLDDFLNLRQRLIVEEFSEFIFAMKRKDVVMIADALIDLSYLILGQCDLMNLPYDSLFQEVHRSNMTKIQGDIKLSPSGKILSNNYYERPRLLMLLRNHVSDRRA